MHDGSAIRPRHRTIDGLSIRYADTGRGGREALLLAPWQESVFAFDQAWSLLGHDTRLVAVDLPGFGHSERRETLLSPKATGQFVIRLADAFGLGNPHAVGPDIGTGALLFAAALNPGAAQSGHRQWGAPRCPPPSAPPYVTGCSTPT